MSFGGTNDSVEHSLIRGMSGVGRQDVERRHFERSRNLHENRSDEAAGLIVAMLPIVAVATFRNFALVAESLDL